MESEIFVVKANEFTGSEGTIMKNYIEKMTFAKLKEMQKQPQNDHIHLTFEKIFDNKERLNFFPIIFQ